VQASPEPITEALRLATPALRRFVENRMSRAHGTRWQDVARESLRSPSPRGDFDLAALISIIVNNQRTAFANEISSRELTWIHELRGVRNQWAHQEPFAPEDIYRALDTIARVLKVAEAPEAATVSMLAKTALERLHAPTPTRPPSAPASPAATTLSASSLAAPAPSTEAVVHRVLRVPSGTPQSTSSGAGQLAASTPDALLGHFVSLFEAGQPYLATYSWIYRRLFGYEPQPWSQGHGVKVINEARTAAPRRLRGVGDVRLDTFIVSRDSRVPGPGYWPSAPCNGDLWNRAFAGAVLLHGDAVAPWESREQKASGSGYIGPLETRPPSGSVSGTGRTVFVLSQRGWVSHGPVRSSELQAHRVADLLRRRIGWTVAVGNHPPAVPSPLPDGLPPIELATLSPVWKDPKLAERWNAHVRKK